MKTYPSAAPFVLNHDGSAALVGYETLRHIDLVTGVETAWPLNGQGAWYVAGWWDDDNPIAFTPTQANPPETKAIIWGVKDGENSEFHGFGPVGHAGLWVYAGDVLSTNGTQIFHNGKAITPPEPFSGVVWSGVACYGYALDGMFKVRMLSDGEVVYADNLGAEQRPYWIQGDVWVSGYSYDVGGTLVRKSDGTFKIVGGEIPGPIFEHAGVVYVVTGIMGSQNNPRGVMVRPWSEFKADGKGWYLDGIRHQFLQARVRPDGHIVIAGAEFPGAGILTLDTIDPSRPMTTVPPEVIETPIDPPPVDPEEPMSDAQFAAVMAKLNQIETKVDGCATAAAVATMLKPIVEKQQKLEELARAQRDGTVGSLFGTQPLTLKPNVKP